MAIQSLIRRLFASVVVLIPAVVPAAEQYLLRYKFVPDQKQVYVSQNDAALTLESSKFREEPRHTEMMIRSIRIVSVSPEGIADLELSINRAYMSANSDGVTSTYDSAHPEKASEDFAKLHESLRKPTLTRMNSLGKLLPMDGQADPEPIDLVMQLPESPIEVGGTWKEKFESGVQIDPKTPLLRPVKMERRYVLKIVEQGIATISLNTVCLTPKIDPFQESQIMQRRPVGTIRFDLNQGCVVERDLRIDDKAVGFQGAGTAMTTRVIKLDRLITSDQASEINLMKPLLSVQAAFESTAPIR